MCVDSAETCKGGMQLPNAELTIRGHVTRVTAWSFRRLKRLVLLNLGGLGWVVVCVGNKEADENGMQLPNTELAKRRSVARLNGKRDDASGSAALMWGWSMKRGSNKCVQHWGRFQAP